MIYKNLNDEELLSALWGEDGNAFKEIYNRYWSKLYAVAYRKIGVKEIAEELVQELFLNLWVKRKTVQINSSLEAYLFSAIKYIIINYYQAQTVRNNYKLTLNSNASTNCTEEAVVAGELEIKFKQGLDSLSTKSRQVFEKSRLHNQTTQEIATDMQLTDKAVEYHITKALKHLRGFLKDFVVPAIAFSFLS
ncbi:RNA polymerase sigma-70 factor [Adhaeribacter aquaticus]|uniref:RNA polymerase sigma-70 factor n=1 Tax=Adhaeribacter aquaticus TaxID=299567 RepID=UPI00041A1751|nr:RNA polymerase sigma-70 factor [Adhaeribacter aquaticus]